MYVFIQIKPSDLKPEKLEEILKAAAEHIQIAPLEEMLRTRQGIVVRNGEHKEVGVLGVME